MQVVLQPSGTIYQSEGKESILDSALKAGLNLNYGCSNGNCGLCQAKLLKGRVKEIRHSDVQLNGEQEILMCCCQAESDIEIYAEEAGGVEDIPWQEIEVRIKKIETLSDGVKSLHVQTPRTKRLRFLAGQSVELNIADGEFTEIPIASCPCDDRNILFHIDNKVQDSLFQRLQAEMKANSSLTLRGPKGCFILQEHKPRPLIFISVGTGFAPIKSIIEHAIALEWPREIALYRIDEGKDVYLDNLCRSWQDALDEFYYQYIPLPQWKESRLVPVLEQIKCWGLFYDSDIYLAAPKRNLDFLRLHLQVPDEQTLAL